MKYIVIALTVIVIIHDISIYRLNRKVHVLCKFFDEVIHKCEEFETMIGGSYEDGKQL